MKSMPFDPYNMEETQLLWTKSPEFEEEAKIPKMIELSQKWTDKLITVTQENKGV
jgi:hypothetical protein